MSSANHLELDNLCSSLEKKLILLLSAAIDYP